jgi:capsular polysaccharide export protein
MILQPQLVAWLAAAGGERRGQATPATDRSRQILSLGRADLRFWPQIAHLFSEFEPDRRSGRKPGALVRFAPGLLRGPGFTRASSWVSGMLTQVAGRQAPGWAGWVAQALREASRPDAARRAQALAIVRRMAREQVGGRFWAASLPDGPERIVLRAARPGDLPGQLDDLLRRHAAAEVLLLMDEMPASVVARAHRLGIETLAGPVNPWSVLARARGLYVDGDDELALLAALTGVRLPCDPPALAQAGADAAGLAAALLLEGVRYGDPRTGQRIDADAAISLLAEWRAVAQRNRAVGCCVGVAFWKRTRLAAFLHDGERPPPFRRSTAAALAVAKDRAIAGWNSRLPPGLAALEPEATTKNRHLLRMEDGFIRSRGLGSGFLPPASIIVDGQGIYYDPRQPSDLEQILAEADFDAALRARARALIDRLNERGITKYQAGGDSAPIAAPPGVRRILVPGQVADDLSVMLGGGAVRDNLALLEHVRAAQPQAWLVYKPHPDVEAGHRAGAVAEADLRRCADQVVRDGAMSSLITAVDEVHTMTSLAGFEALLRGRAVTVLGQPFYAGWGLTTDIAPLARRTRRLHIDELAAGVLILYPRYLDPLSNLPCGPELLIERLDQPELWRPSLLMRLRHLQGILNRRLQMR